MKAWRSQHPAERRRWPPNLSSSSNDIGFAATLAAQEGADAILMVKVGILQGVVCSRGSCCLDCWGLDRFTSPQRSLPYEVTREPNAAEHPQPQYSITSDGMGRCSAMEPIAAKPATRAPPEHNLWGTAHTQDVTAHSEKVTVLSTTVCP